MKFGLNMRSNKNVMLTNFGNFRLRDRKLRHKKASKIGDFWHENLVIRL